jgi:hypothetical protein
LSEYCHLYSAYSPRVLVSYGVLFATSVAFSWTSNAVVLGFLFPVRAFPEITGPFHLATEVHPPVELIPSRASDCLLAIRLVGRIDFPEISLPFDDIP